MATLKNKITIHDIARKAAVSPGTVDRVIHQRPGVSDSTRKEILKLISKLDYQPDILARTLVSKKTIKIAAIYPGMKTGKDFWALPASGMDNAIKELNHFGVQLNKYLFDYPSPGSFALQAKNLLKSKPDGIILASGTDDNAKWMSDSCSILNIPLVCINSQPKNDQYLSFIGQDSFASGKLAASLMNNCLESNDLIAIVNIDMDPEYQFHINEREKGFLQNFTGNLRKNPDQIMAFTIANSSPQQIKKDLKHIFKTNKIKGVFVTNSRSYRLAEWLQTNKKHPPILIGYDLIPKNNYFLNEGIISFLISQKPEDQGYRGVMTLFNYLVLKRPVQKNQLLPIDIITKENLPYYKMI